MDRRSTHPELEGTRFAVLGDIHGNAHALEAAIRDVRAAGISRVVVHGDLLTYGCRPNDVIDLCDGLRETLGAVFIRGNHEDYYFGGLAGDRASFGEKAYAIVESIEWTLGVLSARDLRTRYDWVDAVEAGAVLISHANPWGRGDWRYVRTEDDHVAAAETVRGRGAAIGIFGHTHRARVARVPELWRTPTPTTHPIPRVDWGTVGDAHATDDDGTLIVNAGAVGQPRGSAATWLEVDARGAEVVVRHHVIDYPVGDAMDSVRSAGLSAATTAWLLDFFFREGLA